MKISFYSLILISNILYYHLPSAPEVRHSINTSIGKCFKKKNQELVQELQDQYGSFQIPRYKKYQECNYQKEVMNQAIQEACSKPGDAEKGSIEIRPAVPFVSEATYDSTEKDKGKFVEITCRHTPTGSDSKKNNYQVHVRKFDHGTPEDMLLWYSKMQEIFSKKPCDDPETKFNVTELLLSGQAKRNFLQFKKEECFDKEVLDPNTGLKAPQGVIEETFLASLNRLRDYYFKKYAARYQVAYLRQNLRKPKEVSVRTCATRLQEINNYLSNFPGPDLNTPLAEGEIISILVAMIPSAWHRKMVSINFEPLTKKFIEVIEYLEQLEVLDATEKKQAQKKSEAENKSKEKSKGKGKSQNKGSKGRNRNRKRKAESDDTDEDSKFCAYCKGKGGKYQTHNAEDCWFIKNLGNKGPNKKPKYQNKNSKEFNALVKAEVQKILKKTKNKNKKRDLSSSESGSDSSGEE